MAGCTKQTFILSTLAYLIAGSPITGRDNAALPPVISFNIAEGSDAHLEYPWAIARDGGGGGTVAGKYIINFSDTTTMNTDDFESFGFYPFVSNSIASAIAEYDGMHLTDYGTGYVKQQWALSTDETPLSNHRTAIWPNTNILTGCSGACGYTVSEVIDITFNPYTTNNMYSTVAKITMGADGPSVERMAEKMWYPNEINWGTFALARARDGTDDIFMLANPGEAFGVKVARVPEASIADRSKYTYWDGSAWVATPPAADDKLANIFNYDVNGYGVGTGDMFWSPYYNTWIVVFNDSFAPDNTFRLMYSTNGQIVGPWSTVAQSIYTSSGCTTSGCGTGYNYASHAYPDIDPTGKTLLLGWTYSGSTTQFTTIIFK